MRKNYWSRINRFNRRLRRLSLPEKIKLLAAVKNSDCILLDTPIHGNYGDHAIVQAQKQLLSDMGLKVTELPFPEIMLREKAFARLIPENKTIVVPGGGFLGCLWENEEYEFRRILQGFPNNRIIVFPQTVTFDLESEEGRRFFNESKEIYSAHKKLTLFVRDKASLEFMAENMPQVNCVLAPDTVTAYRPQIKDTSRSGILFCFRNDKEKSISKENMELVYKLVKEQFPGEEIITTDTVGDNPIYPDEREKMLNAKLTEFASSRLVVTDRLHGMILSAITATPCIAFNNSNGKVGSQYEWIKANKYVRMISDPSGLSEIIKSVDIYKDYSYDREAVLSGMQPLFKCISENIRK